MPCWQLSLFITKEAFYRSDAILCTVSQWLVGTVSSCRCSTQLEIIGGLASVAVLEVCLFCCNCVFFSLLLVCAVLKTIHSVKHILSEEECRSVGNGRFWWVDLATVIVVKAPSMVQETLNVLKEYKGDIWYGLTTERIKSKLKLKCTLGKGNFNTKLPYIFTCSSDFNSDCVLTFIV